jgi:hypothetical protein
MAKYTDIHYSRVKSLYTGDNHSVINGLITNNPSKKIIIDQDVTVDKPFIMPSNVCLRVDGALRLSDGVVRPLTQDAAIGQNRVYVNNSDGAYKVGQILSVSASNYPTGGGGSVARKMSQSGKVTVATSTYVEFEFNLRANLSGVAVGNLLVSNGATIGHSQTLIYCRDVNNIKISGTGVIDCKYPTMHNFASCAMGGNSSSVAGYEDSLGGNAIVFWGCDNVSVKGDSNESKLLIQETNIGAVLWVDVNLYEYSNIESRNIYMKHWAGALGVNYGKSENLFFNLSYNEDGLGLHDEVYNSSFKNIHIFSCPRIGFAVGGGSHDNTFEDISIDLCNLNIYTYPSNGSPDVYNNSFKNITINRPISGILIAKVLNSTFENVVITNGRAGNHCITIGGGCDGITFNGGGCYDTNLISSNSGWGFRSVAKESYMVESQNVTFNDFEFKRLNRGIVDLGSFPVTFNNCVLDDNDLNGDLTSPDFTLVGCTVDGLPYP